MAKRGKIFARVLFLLYIASVAVLCFARFNGGVDLNDTWFGLPKDKVVHFLMFLPFPPISYFAFYEPKGRQWRLVLFLVVALVFTMAMGGSTELIQGKISYRSGDIADFRADSLGAFVGAVITLIYSVVTRKI